MFADSFLKYCFVKYVTSTLKNQIFRKGSLGGFQKQRYQKSKKRDPVTQAFKKM